MPLIPFFVPPEIRVPTPVGYFVSKNPTEVGTLNIAVWRFWLPSPDF